LPADPSTKLRDRTGGEPIPVDANRKVLKLALNLMHNIPMPASFVWSVNKDLFALCDELGADSVAQTALTSLCAVVERDPWGMFALGSQRNHFALARAALGALAASENKLRADMNGMNGQHAHPHMHNGFPAYGMNAPYPYGMYPGFGPGPHAHGPHAPANGVPEQGKKKKGAKALGAGELDYASLNLIMNKVGDEVSSPARCSATLTPERPRQHAVPREHDEQPHDVGRALGLRDQLGRRRAQLQAHRGAPPQGRQGRQGQAARARAHRAGQVMSDSE
jgi:hypothetical protein